MSNMVPVALNIKKIATWEHKDGIIYADSKPLLREPNTDKLQSFLRTLCSLRMNTSGAVYAEDVMKVVTHEKSII